MTYRVVIPTAGVGSRLGSLTKYINKSLISIAHRPALSHLIEQFPANCEFVVALGYKGHLVREFIETAYTHRIFYFAEVDTFVGNGSGLGYSLMCCERYLQEPFIFASCDTLVSEEIPPPDSNWVGYSPVDNTSSYRTLCVHENRVHRILEKDDKSVAHGLAYIGLAGVCDYAEFWSAMHQGGDIAHEQGEAFGLRSLLEKNQLAAHQFTWFDTGTPSALELARAKYSQTNSPNILEKPNEAIWFVANRVIKFSDDQLFISNRVKRASLLREFCPQIIRSSPHMYSYDKVEGDVIAKVITLPLFKKLLEHCKVFWKFAELTSTEILNFDNNCRSFYYDKTLSRVALFYQKFGIEDRSETINDEPMPLLSSLLERVDWDYVSSGLPGRFHGDFHFENILWNSHSETFTFLDWRQDFAGSLENVYYDLAKLLHGLIVSHEIISANSFSIEWNEDNIKFDLCRRQIHIDCEKYFECWCQHNGYDFSKVKILTAIIYLNIAALHHNPYSLLLYSLGKSILKSELDQPCPYVYRNTDVILGGKDLEPLYQFKNFPVYMGCVEHDISEDILADMNWSISRNSGFIQLNPLLPLEIVYPESHGSGCVGKIWMQHHSSFANFIKKYNPKSILEIGGAHGILSKLYHSQDPHARWVIVEPNPTPDIDVNARFIKGFFDDQFKLTDPVDAIVHSHVFEHVYNPLEFMQNISCCLEEGKHLIFSLPNMEEMLKNRFNNCLNFEHTIFLTEPYVDYLLSLNGFRILERESFMNQHSIFYACVRDKSVTSSPLSSDLYCYNKSLYLGYVSYYVDQIKTLNNHIAQFSPSTKVYLFGAHVFAQYLIAFGLDTSRIEYLLDNDSNKHGRRLYGSTLLVASPKVLAGQELPVVILKAGVYNAEIKLDILENINNSTVFLE